MSLFEHIAATDDSSRIENRKAAAAAVKRFDLQFGSFIKGASSQEEHTSRMALIEPDLKKMVASVVTEYGSTVPKVREAVEEHVSSFLDPATNAVGDLASGLPGAASDITQAIPGAGALPGIGPALQVGTMADQVGQAVSPEPGTPDSMSLGQPYQYQPVAPGSRQTASVHTARRPKMCPYHSELTDASLQAGEPQYASFSSLVGTDSHCKGGFSGKCNFKPEMVTQEYWDNKQKEYAENRERRELERQQQEEINSIPEPLVEDPAQVSDGTGITDLDSDLSEAPSAVGEQSLEDNAPLEPMALTATSDIDRSKSSRSIQTALSQANGEAAYPPGSAFGPDRYDEEGELALLQKRREEEAKNPQQKTPPQIDFYVPKVAALPKYDEGHPMAEYQPGTETIHTFPDNWTINRLRTNGDYRYEGDMVGHDVAQYIVDGGVNDPVREDYPFPEVYSLRDPNGAGMATWDARVYAQRQKGGPPQEEIRERLRGYDPERFVDEYDFDPYQRGRGREAAAKRALKAAGFDPNDASLLEDQDILDELQACAGTGDPTSQIWCQTLESEAARRGLLGPQDGLSRAVEHFAPKRAGDERKLPSSDGQAPWDGGGAVKTVKLPKADESGLGGPSPEMKTNLPTWRSNGIKPIDTEQEGSRNPTTQQTLWEIRDVNHVKDITTAPDESAEGALGEVDIEMPTTLSEDGNSTEKNLDQSGQGGTWTGTEGQADPVTKDVGELATVSKIIEAYEYKEGPIAYTVNGGVPCLSPEEITGLGLDPKNPRPLTEEELRKLDILRANRLR